MNKNVNRKRDTSRKNATLSFIGFFLKRIGWDAKLKGNSYYVNLGCDSNLVIGFWDGRLSVAVVIRANWEDVDELLVFASLTMTRTTLTKIFLHPENEEMNIWFCSESYCKTRGEFKRVFDGLFKLLMESVRTFIEIRNALIVPIRVDTMSSIVASRMGKQRPS